MRVAKQVTEKKEQFILGWWKKHPDAHANDVNERTIKRYGSGLHMGRVYELRTKAAELASQQTPTPQAPPVIGAAEPTAVSLTQTCANCHKTKNIDLGFGFRTVSGVKKPQSWCRECRAHARESGRPAAHPRRVVSQPIQNGHDGQADLAPRSVLIAANALLTEMRKNRVIAANIEASGVTKFVALKANDVEVKFGGRREGDPAPTVKLTP